MPIGEVIYQRFYLISEDVSAVSPLPLTSNSGECCFVLPVFGETVVTDDLYNDFSSPLFFWGNGFSTANLVLQKYVNGAWADQDDLDNNTYGTYYAFGFWYNSYQQSAVGYNLEWRLVLAAFGEGNYRVKSVGTPLITGSGVTKYSLEYCLKEYKEHRADNTVRIDYLLNGIMGDPEDDRKRKDFGVINWSASVRLPDSVFGYDTSSTEKEYVKYQNGEMKWLRDSQIEEYMLKTGRFPNEVHSLIKKEILQADEIKITDFNINNPTRHKERYVIFNGGYEPDWAYGTMLAPVEIKFQQAYQNLTHKRV